MTKSTTIRVCPRCHAGELTKETDTCPICGFKPRARERGADPAVETIERSVRKELRSEFHLERLLGRGGMSIVYVARERELNRQVALKVLPLQLVMGRDAVERFSREAKIAASLDHPHIVPVHRIGTASTFLWYTMKLVRGRSLEQVLENGPLSVDHTVQILEPVASALYHAHKRGIVHRDIKPGNVLIDQHGWVAVCDFGIAKAFGAVPLTHTGSAVGTPGYMSPEQCQGRPLDGRSDQYSLAILAFESLSGRLPFTANSIGEIVQKHCTMPPPRITEVNPDVPDHVADALITAMNKRPEDRFEDVVAFVEALGGHPLRETSQFQPVELPMATEPAGGLGSWLRHLRSVQGAVGIALFLVGLGVGWLLATRGDSRASAEGSSPPAAGSIAPAYLVVNATPWGEVFLDGERLGPTPLPARQIPAGQHTVRIEREGYASHEQVIEVLPGDTVDLTGLTLVPR